MQQLMGQYFRELGEASRDARRKVAWCTSVGPAELLRAMGFSVYFPENHGAMLGSSRAASSLIGAAHAVGYGPDVCSYLTSDVGAWLRDATAVADLCSVARVPVPDVLVYNTNQCRDVQDWFAFYQRQYNVPMFGIHTPRNLGEITGDVISLIENQLRTLAKQLAPLAPERLDIDRLREVVACSHQCSQAWNRVLRCAVHKPSPLTFFDGCIHMGPAVVLRGDARALQYYETLHAELVERIDGNVAAVDDERVRLYWEGMPIWGRLRDLAQALARQRSCVVASTYCQSWVFDAFVLDDPFCAMATAYTELFIVRDDLFKQDYLARMAKRYDVDGFVFHDAKTCPNNSNCRYGMHHRLAEQLGLPCIVLSGDLNDLRMYSQEQAYTQLEALIEQVQRA